jgi:uncharacterized OsmC-like protein
MILISKELKDGVGKTFERLSSSDDPSKSVTPSIAEAVMIGPQSSEVKWEKFKLVSDEPTSVGGADTAPTPSSIFAASIGFAENVILARQIAMNGLDLEGCTTRVEALWDRRGLFGIGNADPSITSVLIETRVKTQSPPNKIAELVRLNDKRSPMTATVAKAAMIKRRLFVNDQEVPV